MLRTAARTLCALGVASLAGTALVACDRAQPVPVDSERAGSERSGAERSGAERIRASLREHDPFERAQRLAQTLSALGRGDRLDVRAILEDPHLETGLTEMMLLVRYWAGRDPAAAVDWTETRAPVIYRAAANEVALELYARAEPEAALRRIADTRSPFLGLSRDVQLRAVVRGWIASETPGVEAYIRDLGIGIDRQLALEAYARTRIRSGERAELQRWAEALPDEPPRFKLAAMRQVGSELTIDDPAAGVEWCERHCDGPFGDSLRQLVATRWASVDGPAAMRWAAEAPEESRKNAIRGAFVAWNREDSAGLIAFVDAMGLEVVAESPYRPIAEHFARLIALDRPAQALRWTGIIDDPAQRQAVTVAILQRWRASDVGAAEAWIEASSLSEDLRSRAREPLPARTTRSPSPDSDPG